ncbi:MAG: NADH-quinone oxidoreductase subunit L [Ignavibacteria bacterium]|nr:NADH-quinone oxidoreductase subunit L [Ignavibacteria bacterium]
MVDYFYLIFIAPLIGFIVNSLFGKRIKSEKIIGYFSSFVVLISFIVSILSLFEILKLQEDSRKIIVTYFNWISTGLFDVKISFLIDPLSVLMILVVTGVGFLIHIYSIGYMHKDENFALFFAYMNLFIFAMLILVLSESFLLMFLGWEGVGLCSYLLIGFWYEKKFTGDAAKKAFIVNRIGDFGFIIAMLLIFANFRSLSITNFNNTLLSFGLSYDAPIFTSIALLLLLGAVGKSAQIPLFVWLPDAMAGPTPVSALIHAATMVTAGVYLISRVSLLYVMSPTASAIVLVIGILTALLAASIALRQNDIKKILAYSTISQLGFMFVALGAYAYVSALFHLVTHAFFKALLFLGSGCVIHAMAGEQDVTKMGGLKPHMKITYWTFLIGALTISGIPPLSGFFSKDEILFNLYSNNGLIYFLILLLAAAFTAYYMFRLVSLTFYGKPRYDTEKIHPHESPAVMTIPLLVLAFLSIIGGVISHPHYLGLTNFLDTFLKPVFERTVYMKESRLALPEISLSTEMIIIIVSVLVSIIAIVLASRKYSRKESFEEANDFEKILENKYYIDELYEETIVKPVYNISDKILWKIADIKIIDGFINYIAKYFGFLSIVWRKVQTGIFQDYAILAITGLILIILFMLLK